MAVWDNFSRTIRNVRIWRAIALCLVLFVAGYVAYYQTGHTTEQALRIEREKLYTRPASGQIHIVEIDAHSLSKLDQWPWPRQYHARMVDLLRGAGAEQIAFDVDFSSQSRAGGDAEFAAALKRAGGSVILPTLRQARNSAKSIRDGDAAIESLPLPEFAKHAFLASVNVTPDRFGQLNHSPYGTMAGGKPRPSLPVMIGGREGAMGEYFRIDQSIHPGTIPRHSFSDLLDGSEDTSSLKGKNVLIGATAIQTGDRYATARYGVLPGVVIQAMAAETLYQDRAMINIGPLPALLFVILTTLLRFAYLSKRILTARIVTAVQFAAVIAAPYIFEALGWFTLTIVPALTFLILIYGANKLLDFVTALTIARTLDKDSGLPNLAAMQEERPSSAETIVAAMRISNYSDIVMLLNIEQRGALMRGLSERLLMISAESKVFMIDTGSLAWIIPHADIELLPERFDAAAAILRSPVHVGGRSVTVKANFGAAIGVSDDIRPLAMKAQFAAESAARKSERWAWHADSMTDAAEAKIAILEDLERALQFGELYNVYQPKFNVEKNGVSSAEALVRWEHPVKGHIRPDQFIPVLEKEERIDELTLYVLGTAIMDIARWNSLGKHMNVAVNISPLLLSDSAFVRKAIQLIQTAHIDASQITLEVTEAAALDHPEVAVTTLQQFKSLGTRISVDDYGTGQSTLSYLQNFPADEIKIDQAFVKSIAHVETDRIMVRSTIELAHALGFDVVAEGAEDDACYDLLREYGCDYVQGWYIGKPLAAREFEAQWVGGDDSLPKAVNQN